MVPCNEVWAVRGGAPALGIGEGAADRDVEQDREAVVDGCGPGRLPDPGLAHAVELVSVQVPADLLVAGVAPVDDHRVGVEALPAPGAVPQPAAQAALLVARPGRPVGIALGEVPAVQGARGLAQSVDVLHDVDLAGRRPPGRRQHPESRPVTQRIGRAGLLDRGRHHHLAAGRRPEQAPGLDPGRGPSRVAASGGAVAQHDDVEIAVTIQVDVVPGRGHRLDLAGAEDAPAGVEFPVAGVDAAVRRAVEVVGPDLLPRRSLGGRVRRGRAAGADENREERSARQPVAAAVVKHQCAARSPPACWPRCFQSVIVMPGKAYSGPDSALDDRSRPENAAMTRSNAITDRTSSIVSA